MLMGSYFSPMHINYLLAERYLPNHIVLHIDLRSLFFWKKLALMIVHTTREINLEAQKASNLLDTFWCHPFFNNFKQFRYLHLLQTTTKISSDSLHARKIRILSSLERTNRQRYIMNFTIAGLRV